MATAARSMREMATRASRMAFQARSVETRSVGEAARDLGISPSTVRNWVEKGYIHAFRLPSGVRRIPQAEITRMVNEYFAPAPALVAEDDEPSLMFEAIEEEPIWGPAATDSSDRSSSAGIVRDRPSGR